jgi:4-amino-4-deoxy-L-arabinose transferase-like glycosyltransferase
MASFRGGLVRSPAHVSTHGPASAGRVRAQPRRSVLIALAAIVLLGFGLRAAQATDPGRYISSDERSYARIAMNIAAGDGYAVKGSSDPWHWAPGAPALFAAAHLLAPGADGDGSPEQIRTAFWAQALVGAALIAIVFLLASAIAGPIAGLLAAGAIATYPPLIRATGDLVSEPLGALTLALAALALLAAWRRPQAGRIALAGAALGLALLVRADLLVLSPLIGAAWLLLARERAGTRSALAQAAALALIPLAVAAPWSLYASLNAGRLIPVASSGPSTLFVGTYLPGDGKLSGVRRELELYVRRNMSNLAEVRTANIKGEHVLRAYIRERHPGLVPAPYRAIPEDRLRWALAFEARRNLKTFAVHQPLAFAAMELRKVARMWGGYHRGSTRNPRTWLTAWHLALVGLALAGALAGLALAQRRRAELALLLLPVVAATLVSAVFVSQPRHNLRVLPLLVAAGAAGAVLAASALRERRRGRYILPPEADPPGDQITVERRALTSPRVLRYRADRARARARSGSPR